MVEKEERLQHKHFVMVLEDSLLERARVLDYGRTRSVHEKRPVGTKSNREGPKVQYVKANIVSQMIGWPPIEACDDPG